MMTQSEQSSFVRDGMEGLYRALEQMDPIFLKMCGVPEEMQAGPVDEDGWCKWKLVPSTVTAADLDRLEQERGCRFPSLLRVFLSTCCHYFEDAGLGRQTLEKPFSCFENAWNPTLVRGNYLPFLWDTEGYFIRCIDLTNMPDEDRCPVVQIDHERLFDLDEDAGREELAPLMEPVAVSLQAFLSEIFNGWTETQKRRAASRYLQGLQEAYEDAGGEQVWADFMEVKTGVSEQYLADLKALYPELPAGLEALLQFADGTYWREYRPGEKTCLLFLGSDLEEFPYYLLSAKQMMETKDRFADWGKYLILREYDDIPVDEGITHDLAGLRWLHFADCFNNGGCSQLFIDFTPSEKGKAGQIVRYIHDPDELTVIAESFDAYLEMLIENEYDFINEETIEE